MAQETPRHRSPDGRWEWDGTSWVPAGREEATAASRRPAPAGAKRGWSGRRVLVTALLVCLLVLSASGVGGFLVGSSIAAGPGGGVSCDGDYIRCLPVTVDAVVKQLKSNGFSCSERSSSWQCQLAVGLTRYDASLEEYASSRADARKLRGFTINVRLDGDGPPGKGPMACLQWFASMPFADDQPAAAATTSWLIKQVNRHGHQKATINGYQYQLDASKPRTIRLEAQGAIS